MARIAAYREVLKRDSSQRFAIVKEFLSHDDIVSAAADSDYRWRERIWNPALTFWTFLVQVLHPVPPVGKP